MTAAKKNKKTSIAILTMHSEHRPFRGNYHNFIDLIETGKELGAKVSVVTVKDLKPTETKVKSYVYDSETKSWACKLLPLPHVFYNRIPTRQDEQMPDVQQKIQYCLKHGKVRLYNPSFFNKLTLNEWLKKAKTTKKYIPSTYELINLHELEFMLKLHSLVYLKPVRGKAGKGIMKVAFTPGMPETPYCLHIQFRNKSRISLHHSIIELWQKLQRRIGDEKYIIQQGIQLANYKERTFDFRVLMQKNAMGEWSLTGIGARVAGNLSITTHVPRGGSIDEPKKLLNATFGDGSAQRIMRRIKKSAFAIAKQIEKSQGFQLGEMSLDLGVDTSEQIWFLEANSRPMKFDEPDIRKKSLQRIIQYSQFLTQTGKKK